MRVAAGRPWWSYGYNSVMLSEVRSSEGRSYAVEASLPPHDSWSGEATAFDDVHMAIAREKQLKAWSRAKKIALIKVRNPHWLEWAREWYPWMERRDAGRDASTA